MDLNDVLDVDDFAATTVAHLVERISRSAGESQLVYRESELDELWRLLDVEIRNANAADVAALAKLRDAVIAAHDLVGVDAAPAAAAQCLRAGLDAWEKSDNA